MVKPNTFCQNCGKEVYRPPKRFGEKITCSEQCMSELATKNNQIPNAKCAICGKEIVRLQKRGKGFVCSNECFKIYMSTDKSPNCICEYCGKAIYKKPYEIKRSNHVFCSHYCRARKSETSKKFPCAVCGIEVKRHASVMKNSRRNLVFCSREHTSDWLIEHRHERQLNPNLLEIDFLKEFPQLRYVGDGKFWLRDEVGAMNPDFILPETNKIVDLFGDYWHRGQDPSIRIERMRSLGYDAVIIWEGDFRKHFNDTRQLVENFLSGTSYIVSEPSS